MTIMRTLIVACDAPECADDEGHATAAHSHAEARAEAAQHGWTVRLGRDFCPKHQDRPPTRVSHHNSATGVTGTLIQAGNHVSHWQRIPKAVTSANTAGNRDTNLDQDGGWT